MKNYRIIIGSPIEYDYVTAEIVVDDLYVVLMQKEEGEDKMILEFYENGMAKKIYVDDFIKALNEAREMLKK